MNIIKRLSVSLIFSASALMYVSSAQAAVIDLFDWNINNDGTFFEAGFGDTLADAGTADTLTGGLGALSFSIAGAGAHSFDAMFDFEIDEATNTFFNEFGYTVNDGALAAGQSWEIDEPGLGGIFGDIYFNTADSLLDNSNAVPEGLGGEDVSFALGFDFDLLAGETATITLNLSTNQLDVGANFALGHSDLDSVGNDGASPVNIFYWASLDIAGKPVDPPIDVPEPASLALMGLGLMVIGAVRRRKR